MSSASLFFEIWALQISGSLPFVSVIIITVLHFDFHMFCLISSSVCYFSGFLYTLSFCVNSACSGVEIGITWELPSCWGHGLSLSNLFETPYCFQFWLENFWREHASLPSPLSARAILGISCISWHSLISLDVFFWIIWVLPVSGIFQNCHFKVCQECKIKTIRELQKQDQLLRLVKVT